MLVDLIFDGRVVVEFACKVCECIPLVSCYGIGNLFVCNPCDVLRESTLIYLASRSERPNLLPSTPMPEITQGHFFTIISLKINFLLNNNNKALLTAVMFLLEMASKR